MSDPLTPGQIAEIIFRLVSQLESVNAITPELKADAEMAMDELRRPVSTKEMAEVMLVSNKTQERLEKSLRTRSGPN